MSQPPDQHSQVPPRCQDLMQSLRRINQLLERRSRQLWQDQGLTTPQLLILQTLQQHPSLPIGQLAAAINLSQATATAILDRLQERGLVSRQRSNSDRRVVHVQLTPQGANLALQPLLGNGDFVSAFQQLPLWEQSLLVASLQRIAALLESPSSFANSDKSLLKEQADVRYCRRNSL